MRKIVFIFALMAMCSSAFSQKETTQKIKPEIKNVTVFLSGAEVSHDVSLKLAAGRNLLVFEGLSSKLDPRSIRVSSVAAVSILSVSSKVNYLTKNDDKPRIKALKDSVILVTAKIQNLADEKNALNIERDMLLKNQAIGGQQTGVNVAELIKAADFFQTRVFDLNKRISQIDVQNATLTTEMGNINAELIELNSQNSYERSEVSVLVSVEAEQTQNVNLSYYLTDAGWAPYYELKSEEINQPVDLIYRAKVFNNSGIDWNNIDMTLSTADPTQSATQPTLEPWKLNYSDYGIDYNYSWTTNQNQSNLNNEYDYKADKQEAKSGEVLFTQIQVDQLSVEFDIAAKYSIPSDSKPYIVDVKEFNLPATYKYICIPKMDKDAFLLARITGWEDLNLVEGPAMVYFGGTFVGQSYIDTRNVKDTLDLSFGRDKKVLVTRTKLKDYSSDQLIGTKRKETHKFEIVVKNNRKVPISIEIQDQVPVSENSEIEVSADEISNADHNVLTGILTWNFNIEPAKTQNIELQYTMKYPKNKTVKTKYSKFRAVECPKF
ncbi:MAG: DUF4139 domain-containing protein [Bacteroidota bacterium]